MESNVGDAAQALLDAPPWAKAIAIAIALLALALILSLVIILVDTIGSRIA